MIQCTENILLNHSHYIPVNANELLINIQNSLKKDENTNITNYNKQLIIGVNDDGIKKSIDYFIDTVINKEFILSINLFTDITCYLKKLALNKKSFNLNNTVSLETGTEENLGGGIGGGGIGAGGIGGTGSDNDTDLNIPDIIDLFNNGYLFGNNINILFGNSQNIEIPN